MDVKQHFKKNVKTSELRSCVKEKVVVLSSLSITVLMASVDVKQHLKKNVTASELRSCVNFEVAVLGSPSLYSRAGIAQWLERRTRDRKVAGSNPCKSGGRIFFSGVNFPC